MALAPGTASDVNPHRIATEGAGVMARIGRALRHRNYRLFFGGQLVSLVGTFLTNTATSWLVLELTINKGRYGLALGLVGFFSQIPMLLVAPFAGVLVDRLNRQKLLVITQTLAMLQSFTLAYLALTHRIDIPLVMGLSLVQGLINAFDIPGRQAFVVEMVEDREDLPNAIALNSTMVHGARLIGPAAAGLLIAWVGTGYCFLLDGMSYIAVIAALLAMKIKPRPARPARSVLKDLAEGFRYGFGFAPIRVFLLIMALISMTGMPALVVLMPIFGKHFGGASDAAGAQIFGFLGAASGLGALVGALMLAARSSVVGLGPRIALATLAFGAALIGCAMSPYLWLTMLILPLAGWGMITTFAGANTILQTISDDDKRGRVMSLFAMAFLGTTPFGVLVCGWLASRLAPAGAEPVVGASRTMLLTGLVILVGTVLYARTLPGLRKIIHPIYVRKGILPQVAEGLRAAANMSNAGEG